MAQIHKVGIIGYGWVAGANHRSSYARAKDVEIVAVCDVNKAALERAKKDFNLSDLGFSKISDGVPSSTITPSSINSILSATLLANSSS